MTPFSESFLTVQELAGYLGISPTTVYNRLHEWPHLRTTAKGIIRFREQHVEQILESMTQTPQPKPAGPRENRGIGTRAKRKKP
jgi:predicted DNA-binding transcriptional regulator AlpA